MIEQSIEVKKLEVFYNFRFYLICGTVSEKKILKQTICSVVFLKRFDRGIDLNVASY